jgi:hypothetical protein
MEQRGVNFILRKKDVKENVRISVYEKVGGIRYIGVYTHFYSLNLSIL